MEKASGAEKTVKREVKLLYTQEVVWRAEVHLDVRGPRWWCTFAFWMSVGDGVQERHVSVTCRLVSRTVGEDGGHRSEACPQRLLHSGECGCSLEAVLRMCLL